MLKVFEEVKRQGLLAQEHVATQGARWGGGGGGGGTRSLCAVPVPVPVPVPVRRRLSASVWARLAA